MWPEALEYRNYATKFEIVIHKPFFKLCMFLYFPAIAFDFNNAYYCLYKYFLIKSKIECFFMFILCLKYSNLSDNRQI